MKLSKLVLVLSSTLKIVSCVNPITIKIKSLKCEHDPTIYNGSFVCKLKPTRNGYGITITYYNYRKPANDLWYHMKIFYKFGTIYRPFMVDLELDVCKFLKEPHKLPKMFQHLVKVLNEDFPNTFHPCPYFGEEGFREVDVNKAAGKLIPQVVPKGYYKIINRFHLNPEDNRTYFTATLEVYIDATDPLKSFDIG